VPPAAGTRACWRWPALCILTNRHLRRQVQTPGRDLRRQPRDASVKHVFVDSDAFFGMFVPEDATISAPWSSSRAPTSQDWQLVTTNVVGHRTPRPHSQPCSRREGECPRVPRCDRRVEVARSREWANLMRPALSPSCVRTRTRPTPSATPSAHGAPEYPGGHRLEVHREQLGMRH